MEWGPDCSGKLVGRTPTLWRRAPGDCRSEGLLKKEKTVFDLKAILSLNSVGFINLVRCYFHPNENDVMAFNLTSFGILDKP